MPPVTAITLILCATTQAPSAEELAPFLKMVSAQAGFPGRVACRDVDMAMVLKRQGVSLDARSKVAWASTPEQVQGFVREGKFVIVGSVDLLEQGASLALVREGSRISLLLSKVHVESSGIQLSDALLKLGRWV